MSDDEYMEDVEDYGFVSSPSPFLLFYFQEYEDDSGDEPDVDLENQYYSAKGLKSEGKMGDAIMAFQTVRILSIKG